MTGKRAKADHNPFAVLHDELLMRGLGPSVAAGVPLDSVQHLGALVRRQRFKLGLTQGQLAKKANVGRRFVSEVEGGKRTLRAAELLAVSAAAELSITVRPRAKQLELADANFTNHSHVAGPFEEQSSKSASLSDECG